MYQVRASLGLRFPTSSMYPMRNIDRVSPRLAFSLSAASSFFEREVLGGGRVGVPTTGGWVFPAWVSSCEDPISSRISRLSRYTSARVRPTYAYRSPV